MGILVYAIVFRILIKRYADVVVSVSVHPDKNIIASGSLDKTVKIYYGSWFFNICIASLWFSGLWYN